MDILGLMWGAICQVLSFACIPFVWWLCTGRKKESFFSWIGLKKVHGDLKKISICTTIFIMSCIISQLFLVPYLIPKGVTVQSSYAGQGWTALVPVFFFAMIQTGLSEEIFFRGFLSKRLCNKWGFTVGNLIQGFLFGLLHGVLFFVVTTPIKAIIIVLITGFSGWLLGYLTEKGSGGSIIPAWLVHGLGNLILAMVEAFGML
ncbi:MAG: CPBP family intramembrane glutamic endopeptidase [Cellulosilyticaceae bacterium]